MNRAAILSTLIALSFSIGCQGDASRAKLPNGPQAAKAPPPKAAEALAPAAAGTLPADLSRAGTLTGTVEPHRRSTLTPQVSGVVGKVHVREGQKVENGALLVTLKQEDFDLRVHQASVMVELARVQRDSAEVEWKRQSALLGDKAIPQNQFDMIDTQYRASKVGVEQAEVALKMAQKAKRDSLITAPYAGLITARHVSEGEYAAMMPATRLLTIEENQIVDLFIQVPENELGRLKVGDPVKVTFHAVNKVVDSKITRTVPSLNPATRTFLAIAELKNEDGALSAGMFAEVDLLRQ